MLFNMHAMTYTETDAPRVTSTHVSCNSQVPCYLRVVPTANDVSFMQARTLVLFLTSQQHLSPGAQTGSRGQHGGPEEDTKEDSTVTRARDAVLRQVQVRVCVRASQSANRVDTISRNMAYLAQLVVHHVVSDLVWDRPRCFYKQGQKSSLHPPDLGETLENELT